MQRSHTWTTGALRLTLLAFAAFLGTVIYRADVGAGPRYSGMAGPRPAGDKVCRFGFMFTLTALTNLASLSPGSSREPGHFSSGPSS